MQIHTKGFKIEQFLKYWINYKMKLPHFSGWTTKEKIIVRP